MAANLLGGPVTIGPLTFSVCELSVAGETGLGSRLRGMAKKAMGPGSFWAEAGPVIDWLKAQERFADMTVQQQVTAQLVATRGGVSDDYLAEFRQSAAGVIEEMYVRTRKSHPDATIDDFRAVINDANALDVYFQIQDAISPKKAATP